MKTYKGWTFEQSGWDYGFTSKGRGTIKKGKIYVSNPLYPALGGKWCANVAEAKRFVNEQVK